MTATPGASDPPAAAAASAAATAAATAAVAMVKEVLKSEVQLAVRDAMGDPYLQQINEVRLQSQMKDTLTSVLKESNVLLNKEEIRWQMIAGFERYVEGFKDNMNLSLIHI